jgi:hypothetical protein
MLDLFLNLEQQGPLFFLYLLVFFYVAYFGSRKLVEVKMWSAGKFSTLFHKVWFLGELHLKHDLWADCITSLSNVQKWSRQACRHT